MTDDLTPNQWTILESLKLGAVWTRSFQPVKPLLVDLIERRLVDRCRPILGRGHNMVRLSPEGCALLDISFASVPAFRDAALKVCAPIARAPKSNRTAEAKSLLADVKEWCLKTGTAETAIGHVLFLHPGFVGLLRKRLTVTAEKEEEVRAFLTEHPFGWPGTLPVKHANGTRPVKHPAVGRPPLPAMRATVDRTPCSYCGTRADFGCKHQPVAP